MPLRLLKLAFEQQNGMSISMAKCRSLAGTQDAHMGAWLTEVVR